MIKLIGQIKSVTKLAGSIFSAGSSNSLNVKLQAKTVTPSSETQVVTPDGGYVGLYKVNVDPITLQEKTVVPSTGGVVVTPDYGYNGIGKVTVKPAVLQEKTVFPKEEEQEVTPADGYFGMGKVIVTAARLQEKEITPATEDQTIKPDGGFYGLASVLVKGVNTNGVAGSGVRVTNVEASSGGTFTITFKDGSEVSGIVDFDRNGQPTGLIDTNNVSVEFSNGYPTGVTHPDGHTVTIEGV